MHLLHQDNGTLYDAAGMRVFFRKQINSGTMASATGAYCTGKGSFSRRMNMSLIAG